MREEKVAKLKLECDKLRKEVEKLEAEISDSETERQEEKEMRYLTRLIYAGKILEKVGLLYSFNEPSLCEILAANKDKIQKAIGKD